MGQKIEVNATPIGNVTIFDLNRSLTGQDGMTFHQPPEGGTPPEELARRLWAADTQVNNVHVLSNTVSVRRDQDWAPADVASASGIITDLFVYWVAESPEDRIERLREENYNATISWIREHNPDLWVMRVTPDQPVEPFKAGQYTTLGLGYWEPRADDALEDFEENPEQFEKMALRSYSVASSIIDESGELVPAHPDEIEFYLVQVHPDHDEIPTLTPRIFKKTVGDRIYMGRKFTGRYTLDGVEPHHNVVFLSTGTGEAPQNHMSAELFRNDHQGQILQVVCVRYKSDLAYSEQQATVEATFSNYTYVTLTTREPDNQGRKVYIQDMLEAGEVEEALGHPLDPSNTHVFLCGNPLMIGIPTWDDDDNPQFPEPRGVCQILHERGFTIDRGRERGNVHYEEFWTD